MIENSSQGHNLVQCISSMSCQNQHFLCNIIPIGHLKDPFLDKQSPTILMTLNILMTIRFFFIDNLSLKLQKKNQYLRNIASIYAEKCGRIQVYILYRTIKHVLQ